jgi:hypothetical protein
VSPYCGVSFYQLPPAPSPDLDSTTGSSAAFSTPQPEEEEGSGIEDVLAIFRIFKLARVLKLARCTVPPTASTLPRHSPGLQAIAYTLKHSFKELLLLVFLMLMSGMIFASFCYFIEVDQDSGFTSIPAGFYWVVVTMTTVGWRARGGQAGPRSATAISTRRPASASLSAPCAPSRVRPGNLCSCIFTSQGVLVLSLPIPIIAGNFEAFHKANQAGEKAKKRKQLLLSNKEQEERQRAEFVSTTARFVEGVMGGWVLSWIYGKTTYFPSA